ncbi:hypothetical protein TWF730_006465 [Orbilia blumenaviensis]|uniref:Uncharacterized protein n=1 Tax=Orbilia blumenaviensis TaxID=1796055 RepID=A0AAV9VGU3_9PEZI
MAAIWRVNNSSSHSRSQSSPAGATAAVVPGIGTGTGAGTGTSTSSSTPASPSLSASAAPVNTTVTATATATATASSASLSSSSSSSSSSAPVEGPPDIDIDLIDLIPIPPSTPPQRSLVLLHSPSKRRIPHRQSPLRITTNTNTNNNNFNLNDLEHAINPSPGNTNSTLNTNNNNPDDSSPTAQHTTTSYATLSLLSAVGSGSGRRKLKEFPGLIPLSRYFIPPSPTPSNTSATPVAGTSPTTPTGPPPSHFLPLPSIFSGGGGGAEEQKDAQKKEGQEEKVDTYTVKPIGSAFTTPNISPTNTTFKERDEQQKTAEQTRAPPPDGIQPDDTDMEQQPPVAIVGDPEPLMTQDLLNFYKNRLHELEKSSQQELLERISVLRGFLLEHHDATNRLERQLHELQEENEALSEELQETVKHKVEIIALQKENEVLKEKIDQLSRNQDHLPYPIAPIPSPDPSVTSSSKEEPQEMGYDKIQTHYEDLISQLLAKFTEQSNARYSERALATQNIDQLNDRCRRLETAVSDSLKDTILERGKRVGLEEKLKETEEELNVSVWEMQSQIEIFERHINESRMSPEGLQTVHEEGASGFDGADDEEFGTMIPPEMFDDLPDTGMRRSSTIGSISPKRLSGSVSPRKTPSPTKQRRTPSPTSNVRDSGIQTEEESADVKDIAALRQELSDMIADRRAEEEDLKTKRADLEATYEKFIGIIEQAKSREDEYNNLKAETVELRQQVDELLEQHEFDHEELLTRQHDLDAMFEQLEGALKQGVEDKKEITRLNKEVEDLRKQMEEVDSVSIFKDDSEIKELKAQIEEVRKEKEALEEKLEKANMEVQGLKDLVEALNQERPGDKGKEQEKEKEEPQSPTDEVEMLRKKLETTNKDFAALRTRLLELEISKLTAEKETSRKEGDLKQLREQMHNLTKGQVEKVTELTRARDELDNLRKRYDELLSDRKKDDDSRHGKFMELESVKQRLEDVMRIKEQEALLHQKDADAWKRKDEESQEELKKVSGRLAEMVIEVEGRNEVMKALNETIEKLKEADEASGVAIEDANKKIQELEKELAKFTDLESKKESAEKELEVLKTMTKDLEDKMNKHQAAVSSEEDRDRIEELEHQLAEVNAHLEKVIEEADLEIEALAKDLEEAKVHTVDIATEAEDRITSLEDEVEKLNRIPEALKQAAESRINELTNALDVVKTAAEEKITHLESMLIETKDYAEKQVNAAENEMKKLDMQMKVEEARAAATVAAATDRVAVLEKQMKTFDTLKRHKAQDESDLQLLKSHVVKIERIALQYLPLEDSGMLIAIDELKKSYLETQQKHKKRRKKEMIMAEKSGVQL